MQAIIMYQYGTINLELWTPEKSMNTQLSQIGITHPIEAISLKDSQIRIKLYPSKKTDRLLIDLLKESDTLHTANEACRAVYCKNIHVMDEVENNLKIGKYENAQELIKDAEIIEKRIGARNRKKEKER